MNPALDDGSRGRDIRSEGGLAKEDFFPQFLAVERRPGDDEGGHDAPLHFFRLCFLLLGYKLTGEKYEERGRRWTKVFIFLEILIKRGIVKVVPKFNFHFEMPLMFAKCPPTIPS